MRSRARSRSTPLCWRRAWYSAPNRSRSSPSLGLTTRAPARSTPSIAARAWMARGSPRMVRSAIFRRSTMSAAWRTRSSSPSGSTMWRRSATARSSSWCSNISGVTASLRATSSRSSRASPSTYSSNSASAVATLRGESLSRRPRRVVSAVAVSLVPKSVSMIGIVVWTPSMSLPTWGASGMPPLRTIPDICGKFADTWAVRTPRTTSGRSPAATTTAPSNSRSSTLGSVIAAMTRPVASCASRRSSPLTSLPSQASIMSPTEGAFSRGSSGSANAGASSPASAASTSSRVAGSARLATIANSEPRLASSSVAATSAVVWQLLRGLAVRVDDEHHRGPQVGRDAGVERELRRRPDVGVVTPHHDHGVRLLGHQVVALHDPAERGVRVSVQLGVGHTGALVVGQGNGIVRDQQVEHVVDGVLLAHDGAKDRDPLDPLGQLLEDPEGHRGLAGEAFDGCDVHAPGHGRSLSGPAPHRIERRVTGRGRPP